MGSLVLVSIKSKLEFGIILSEDENQNFKTKKIEKVFPIIYEKNQLDFFKSLNSKIFGTILKNSKTIFEKLISSSEIKKLNFKIEKNFNKRRGFSKNFIQILENKDFQNTIFVGATNKESWILDFQKISYKKNFSFFSSENLFISKNFIVLPFKNIEKIVLLNYHKKEFFGFFDQKDVDFLDLFESLAKFLKIPIFFHSATPNFSEAKSLKISNLKFFPKSFIVSLDSERKKGNFGILSEFSKEKILSKKRILVLWNKKTDGFFECMECGFISQKIEDICPICKGYNFYQKSKGINQIQKNLEKEVGKGVEIFEKEKKVKDFEILLSTTAIFDSKKISDFQFDLIIILNTQNLFFQKDENSDEKFFQKIFDISFESFANDLEVIFQSFNYLDPLLQFGAFLNYQGFFEWMKDQNF